MDETQGLDCLKMKSAGVAFVKGRDMLDGKTQNPSPNSPMKDNLMESETNDNELQNRLDIMENKEVKKEKPPLSPHIVRTLMDVLSTNPYAVFLRRLDHNSLDSCRIHIRNDVKLDQRVYNSPSADQVAAIWIELPKGLLIMY
ncbi:hypothetical protein RHGRI_025860 [Rhododendron griersonianum]|uniref:Uncharacterized protein n=1 Tax=Rhododendron griersonianum TaxID=479676 RepID=A0AAV6IW41_9ERIC|nr:hypothetical protein RHGRI_025860 [Rhododendron griersonianum]